MVHARGRAQAAALLPPDERIGREDHRPAPCDAPAEDAVLGPAEVLREAARGGPGGAREGQRPRERQRRVERLTEQPAVEPHVQVGPPRLLRVGVAGDRLRALERGVRRDAAVAGRHPGRRLLRERLPQRVQPALHRHAPDVGRGDDVVGGRGDPGVAAGGDVRPGRQEHAEPRLVGGPRVEPVQRPVARAAVDDQELVAVAQLRPDVVDQRVDALRLVEHGGHDAHRTPEREAGARTRGRPRRGRQERTLRALGDRAEAQRAPAHRPQRARDRRQGVRHGDDVRR